MIRFKNKKQKHKQSNKVKKKKTKIPNSNRYLLLGFYESIKDRNASGAHLVILYVNEYMKSMPY